MEWRIAKKSPMVSIALIGCGLAVCAWQVEEHLRFETAAREAMVKRGRDITSTFGLVLRSQRRYGFILNKERLEPSLEALVQSEELVSLTVLAATGEPLASAGRSLDLTPNLLPNLEKDGGVHWGRTFTMLNLMDLGTAGSDEHASPTPAIALMTDDERRSLRDANRSGADRPAGADREPPGSIPKEGAPSSGTTSASPAAPVPPVAAPPPATPLVQGGPPLPPAMPPGPPVRPLFGKPSWMTDAQYNAVIHEKGVHSLVISLSREELDQNVRRDLLLRSLVSLLAMGGGIISTLAWRNVEKNAELQIRLVKAGETNAHLKELSFAAAGLAHETRNPLNLIRGLAQMVAIEAQDIPKLKEHASGIIEEVDRVTVQLNEFIDYSKPREAHFGPVELKRLVADVARTLLPDIEEKQIRLMQPDAECLVMADEPLLRQALFNVLLNALQAVGAGGQIWIRVTPVGPSEAVLEIADDGPGVPPSERENIFKPYVTMRPKGAGLGLAIVQQIASAHRWDVVCLANEPRGALFRFSHLRIAAHHV